MPSKVGSVVIAVMVLLSTAVGLSAAETRPGAGGELATGEAASGGAALAAQTATSNAALASGSSFWQGQRLRIDASSVVEGSDAGRTFEVWRVTADGRLNQQVGEFTVGEDGTHVLDTSPYLGRVVLRYDGQPVYVSGGTAYLASPPDGAAVTVDDSAFEVARQTLSFSWSDPTAYPGQRVTLTVESNRASSVVAVSGGNLSFRNLTTLFPESAYAENYDARSNDSAILLKLDGTTSLELRTRVLSSGAAALRFDVVDATTVETATLDVLSPGDNRQFDSIERTEQVGDVVEANLTCGHCFLVVGGPDQGFLDVLEISDDNGDGVVELRINTRYAGMHSSQPGYPSGVEAYSSPDDEVARYSSSDEFETLTSEVITDTSSLGDLREVYDFEANGRLRPLPPGEVRLTLASSDYIVPRFDWGSQAPFGSDLVVRDESDVRTVSLEPRSLDGIAVSGAPGGGGYEGTASQLRDISGDRGSVALGDRIVFRVDASGIHGYVAANGLTVEELIVDQGEGMSVSLEKVSGDDAGPVQLDRAASSLVHDPQADALYLVIRTGEASPNWLKAGEYRATFSVEGVHGKYGEYSTKNAFDGYPYLPPGESETVTGGATVSTATAAITTPEPGSSPRVTAEGTLELEGETNVAGGTPLSVVATSTEYAWETRSTATVAADGTWRASFDLAEAPGESFDVSVQREGTQLTAASFTVRPPATGNSSGNATSGGSDGGQGGNGGAGSTDESAGGLLAPLGSLSGLAVPVGGGLGGLVVVWGLWRFVIRRIIL